MQEYQQHSSDEESKIRLALMKTVERVVRPVRASRTRKRKIRVELLGHLSDIYEEELERVGVTRAALELARQRFGSTDLLTTELQATVPWIERYEYFLESRFGWRVKESLARYMFRATYMTAIMVFLTFLFTALPLYFLDLTLARHRYGIRPLVAFTFIVPPLLGVAGLQYFSIRDSMFGAFGSRKSYAAVVTRAALLAVFAATGAGLFLMVAYADPSAAVAAAVPCAMIGLISAAGIVVTAVVMGPDEICDTKWALLDLSDRPSIAE